MAPTDGTGALLVPPAPTPLPPPQGGSPAPRRSDVEIGHLERVLLDELAARLDDVAHQLDEQVVGVVGVA